MKSFDEWLDTTKLRGYMDENSLEAAWEAGQQSRQQEVEQLQTEIDELQKRAKELELINFDSELHFDAAKEHIDCLQERINEALRHVVDRGGYNDLTHIINILKGQNHD